MKISEKWLRTLVDPPVTTDELARQMTMAGLEVDRVETPGALLEDVVVGKVLETGPHPNADRLTLCQVDAGDDAPLTIVCGAPNVTALAFYPVARVGTRLPGGMKIRKSKIRGAMSHGMLCSAAELGIGGDSDGILEIPGEHVPGASLVTALGLDDAVIDLDLTPNRADCFSLTGVAREVAAANGLAFEPPPVEAVAASIDDVFPVRVSNPEGCARFAGRVLRGIDNRAVTPDWMRQRLERSGIRAINPVVDATNYVMMELGCPMHAYDLASLAGEIDVRFARKGERFQLLDEQEIEPDDDVLLVTDDSGPIALAGIMGGASTSVVADTTDVFLECAFWLPGMIAGKARRFGLHTDASMRYERGVDPHGQVPAIERASALILSIAGGRAGPVSEAVDESYLPALGDVSLRRARLHALLGVEIEDSQVETILRQLGFGVVAAADGWTVTPHSGRFDIEIEADIIEEVARVFGYDNIPASPTGGFVPLGEATESVVDPVRIGDMLVDRGYQEVITYSFIDEASDRAYSGGKAGLPLSNPISSELSVMRQCLWPGLVDVLRANSARQRSRVRLFELGTLFDNSTGNIVERQVISGLAGGDVVPEQWGAGQGSVDFFDIKSDLEAVFKLTATAGEFSFEQDKHVALRPGRTARIKRRGQGIGWLGELHPGLVRDGGLDRAPVLFEVELIPLISAALPVFKDVSRYPVVRRDLAVLVARDVAAGALLDEARLAAGPVLQDVVIFDVYMGRNIDSSLKSVALGLILQETSRTLTDTDAEEITRTVVERLADRFGASIRE